MNYTEYGIFGIMALVFLATFFVIRDLFKATAEEEPLPNLTAEEAKRITDEVNKSEVLTLTDILKAVNKNASMGSSSAYVRGNIPIEVCEQLQALGYSICGVFPHYGIGWQ